jgi:hypothetical protein
LWHSRSEPEILVVVFLSAHLVSPGSHEHFDQRGSTTTQKGEHPMSAEDNQVLVHRFFEELWNVGTEDLTKEEDL